MTITKWALPAALIAALGLTGCGEIFSGDSESGITAAALVGAGEDEANWITHGRTYSEQRFSPLDQVNAETMNCCLQPSLHTILQ